jgi:LPPG:FO 2-phospho-L-lactate transferase
MNIVVLSGGVGGARFLSGLISLVDCADLTVVGNVGDDQEVLGLHVSPDLDTVLYTLAGVADGEKGWGRADETREALATVSILGGEDWFGLGDRDIGLHLVRTQLLHQGVSLSDITDSFRRSLGVACAIIPATNDRLRTSIRSGAEVFPFQEWFVARQHRDPVDAVEYVGASAASPAPGIEKAIEAADLIFITPSNPFTSIGSILAVDGIRSALMRRTAPCVAVSPLIGGRAVKGPAGEMMQRLCGGAGPADIASFYAGAIDVILYDSLDGAVELPQGVHGIADDILMDGETGRRRVAEAALRGAATIA